MIISEQTRNFIQSADDLSGNKIKFRDEVSTIVEHFSVINDAEKFEELIFKAKYLNGLMKVFASSAQNPEITNLEQIQKDFTENFGQFREILSAVISSLEENLKADMNRKFLELTPEAMLNTKSLIGDFDWVKRFLNDVRRGRADQI